MTIENVPLSHRHLYSQFCYYCGCKMSKRRKDHFYRVTIDHKIPLSRGGSDDASNKVRACNFCNKTKSNMTDDEFWTWLFVQRLSFQGRHYMNKKEYLSFIGLRK